MALSAAQLDAVANSALDFYFNKSKALQQSIQDRPLLAALESKAKQFPGGKENIIVTVQGAYGDGSGNDTVKGYTADDTVVFYNPANLTPAAYPWREHHIGLTVTHTELKNDGISVSDEFGNTSQHSGREATMLINLFENKLFDFGEQYARGMNGLAWGDGSGDAKALAGIQALITADPSTGSVGGINRATAGNEYWRNRAYTAAMDAAVTATPALSKWGGGPITVNAAGGGALWQQLQKEARQLRRYGGKPDMFLAGSDFIGGLELELRSNGYYTQSGFRKGGDGAIGPVLFDGTAIKYDPTLDDLGYSKRAYWFDSRHIFLMKMQGEWRKVHKPARPENKFVLYRSITSTGQLVASQLNSALVIDID